ncbi:HUWE1-associated protein modifying stress responses 1 isoform X2 [Cynocephalus volans]|uniref:HUWE1-associated protein modifying stress responses 1 isoform X2 n=1 Tax=Cynocephalus volans TaxID=110931 RepID=UPI002FC74839
MEERKEEGEAEIQEHGPEHWFSKWERQCLAEAEQDEQLSPELQEEAAAAAQPEHKQQKLWHLFQNSATAVAQLYKDRVCQQPGLSLWVPFQNAATAVTNLYKESVDTHQRSFDIGIQIGYQRRNKDVLAWVKKRRRTIRREDLISFLCGKVPPPRNSRAPPRLTVVSPNRATSTETSSSVETDLQPFREAIALHELLLFLSSLLLWPFWPFLSFTDLDYVPRDSSHSCHLLQVLQEPSSSSLPDMYVLHKHSLLTAKRICPFVLWSHFPGCPTR